REATYAINGAMNGVEDRLRRFDAWQQKLTPDVMQRLTHGDVGEQASLGQAPGQPGTAGNRLFDDARTQLQQLGPRSGLQSERELDNAAGALAVSAQKAGLQQIDHVVAGNDGRMLFAVQGTMGDPAMLRASVDRAQAAQQPLEQSSQQLAAAQDRQQEQAVSREQDQQRSRSM
ncbi:XVIPCD domain-containing protein, partial [Diaphorobacter nitroreducens]|uniref:XVIPCD domain-containing protein n=1 Tax=Diaphorobacter nitroreducens TaxID=164759 RepID=UPI0028AA4C8C